MKKIKIWLLILCVVVVAVTFFMIRHNRNKMEEDNQLKDYEIADEPQNTLQDEDIMDENAEDNASIENEVTNQVQNTVTNTADLTNTTNTNQPISNAPAIPAVTDQKQKAIELVKKKWGTDNSVDFLFEYINENGEYVVSVKDKATATVKYYFRVNLETKDVELD